MAAVAVDPTYLTGIAMSKWVGRTATDIFAELPPELAKELEPWLIASVVTTDRTYSGASTMEIEVTSAADTTQKFTYTVDLNPYNANSYLVNSYLAPASTGGTTYLGEQDGISVYSSNTFSYGTYTVPTKLSNTDEEMDKVHARLVKAVDAIEALKDVVQAQGQAISKLAQELKTVKDKLDYYEAPRGHGKRSL